MAATVVKRALDPERQAEQRLHDQTKYPGCDIRLPFGGLRLRLRISENPPRAGFHPGLRLAGRLRSTLRS